MNLGYYKLSLLVPNGVWIFAVEILTFHSDKKVCDEKCMNDMILSNMGDSIFIYEKGKLHHAEIYTSLI